MKLTRLTLSTILLCNFFFALAQDDETIFNNLIRSCDSLLYDQPHQSLQYAEEAHVIASGLKNDSLIALSLNRIGSAHWSLGNQMEALQKIQASLQLSELNNFKYIIAKNLGNIGNVYAASGLDLDAIGYYKSELEIQKESKSNTFRLFAINNNIGKAFLDLNYYDSAHRYLSDAKEYLDPKFVHLHSIYFFNLAELSFKEGDIERADSLIQLTFENARQFDSKRGIIRANQLNAEIELYKGNKDRALTCAKESFNLALETDVKELIYIASKTLSKCYGAIGNYQEAYEKQLLHEKYLDSVQSVTTVNELELLSYYQRLFKMRVLESKSELNEKLAEQRQLIIQGLVVALVIAAILIAIIVMVVRELGIRKRKLESLNEFKAKIFAIVSHDLKSPIQSVSSVIEMFNEKLISKEEIEPLLPEVKEKTTNLMSLLNNVFLWAEGQMEEYDLKKEDFQLKQVLDDLINELKERLVEKNITLDMNVEDDFQLHSNPGIVRILLRNLIVNAVKFSHADSSVKINAVSGDKVKVIEVIDSGVGMSEEIRQNLFSGGLVSMNGTLGEKGNGLGLALCSDFVKRLGGRIEAESELGKGSVFRIILNDPGAQR